MQPMPLFLRLTYKFDDTMKKFILTHIMANLILILVCHASPNFVSSTVSAQTAEDASFQIRKIFQSIENNRLNTLDDSFVYSENLPTQSFYTELEIETPNDGIGGGCPKSKVYFGYDRDMNKTETILMRWNDSTRTWRNYQRELPTYTSDGNPRELNYQQWNIQKEQWNNLCREIYAYDRNGYLLQSDFQATKAGKWFNLQRDTYLYENGDLTQQLQYKWNAASNNWENEQHFIYTYDAEGYQTECITQVSENGKKNWQNHSRSSYESISDEEMLRVQFITTEQTWTGKYWTNNRRTISINDDLTRQAENISQYWDEKSNQWTNDVRRLKSYQEQGSIQSAETFYWDEQNHAWQNASQNTYIYDENGRMHQCIEQIWVNNDCSPKWVNSTVSTYGYANEGERIDP